jgi:hypothetical protein
MKKKFLLTSLFTLTLFFVTPSLVAQEDLLKELEQDEKQEKEYTFATFKGTRAVNGHSVETKGKGELEFIISHRFGTLNSGAYEFWGLDASSIRIGLEYGVTDRFGIGIGRSSLNKIVDGYLKYKLLRQTNDEMPVTVTAFFSTAIQTYPQNTSDTTVNFSDRLTYTTQLLIAKKITPKLSLQISPTLLHSNHATATQNNDEFAVGFAGRYKLTKSLSINTEYYHRVNANEDSPYYNSFAIGFDIETGGHVFQLIFANTQGMVEKTFINESAGDFFGGDINFGFNITRTFQLRK